MNRCTPIVLIAGLFLAGCAGTPPAEKPKDVFTENGAVLMQSAIDSDSKQAVAQMLCAKRGLQEDTREFARCVMALHARDRALSRARVRQDRAATDRRAQLCMIPGEFSLTHCHEI